MTSVRGVAALAAAVALLAMAPFLVAGISPDFVHFDDDANIFENAQVRQGLTPRTALWALTTTEHANWYPLRRLSHLADVSLFGLDARGHHLVSVGWHAGAAALLFLALRLMTGAAWRSFSAAGLFAVHPLQVESVAWAAERSNVLAGFLFALTLLLWARYARRPVAGRYAAALAVFALGLMAKPILVTVPLLLLVLDVWPLGRPGVATPAPRDRGFRRLILEKTPFLLLSLAAGAMAVIAHGQAKALTEFDKLPLGLRLGNAALSYATYIRKLLWPAGLAVYYPHPGGGLAVGAAALAGLLLAALTVVALSQARRRPWLGAGWLWFAGMLVPMSGIVQFGGHAMADRFAYLPSVGVFVALVWLAAEELPARRRPAAGRGALAGAVLASFAAATVVQAGFWRDSETLFRHALSVTTRNDVMLNNLAGILGNSARDEEAVDLLEEAARINPAYCDAHLNLGSALVRLRRYPESLAPFDRALACHEARKSGPDVLADIHTKIGLVLAVIDRQAAAERHFREVLKLKPGDAAARRGLSEALARQGRGSR
jgi:hypothetical protein